MGTKHHNGHKLKVFFRKARVLTRSEIEELPAEKRKEVEANGESGIWLEVDTERPAISGS